MKTSKEEEELSLCVGDRNRRFLGKMLAGKPDLALSEDKRIAAIPIPSEQDSDNSLYVKELENTGLNSCGKRNLVSSENPTLAPASDLDLIHEQTFHREFLDIIDSYDSDDDVSSVYSRPFVI